MKRRPDIPIDELVRGTTRGDIRAASRLIRLIDDQHPLARQALKDLFPYTGHAQVVGITGPPGAGKSTLIDCLIEQARGAGLAVGVLAVDPSSPFTGGAILGDRVRMNRFALDDKVFVRSLATRGHFGGITPATRGAIRVMDALGKDIILVETVGVGQDEIDIARIADTTLVVAVPGLGDDIQAMKAGILEVADIFVVNKSDHSEADKTVAYLTDIVRRWPRQDFMPPIVKTVALRRLGVAELWQAVRHHRDYRQSARTASESQRLADCRCELELFLQERLREQLALKLETATDLQALVQGIASGELDIYVAADQLLSELTLN